MSTVATVVVIVVVLVVLAVVAALALRRDGGARGMGSGMRLKRQFGPEYDRTLERHDGDAKAAKHELSERVKRYGDLDLRPVSGQDEERYTNQWAELQARFVDEPGRAVSDADRLIARLAADRGFPGSESPEHFDALSVHHPHQVQGYRTTHALAEHAGGTNSADGSRVTEDLRQAMLSSRGMFEELLHDGGTGKDTGVTGAKGDRPTYEAVAVPGADGEAASEHPVDDTTVDGTAVDESPMERTALDGTTVPDSRTAPRSENVPTGADRDRGDADDVAEDGSERHRPLSDRFAALTGGRKQHTDADADPRSDKDL